MKYNRSFTIVIDSMGIGAMPNAAEYGDEGCDTLGHIDDHMPELSFQIWRSLALPACTP